MAYNRIWLVGALRGNPVLRFARDGSAETRFTLAIHAGDGEGGEVEVRCRGSWATDIADGIDAGDPALVEGYLALGYRDGGYRDGEGMASGTPERGLVVLATKIERL